MVELLSPYRYGEGYITLDIPLAGLPKKLDLAGTTYDAKSEYHCSVIAIKKLLPKLMERDKLSESAAEVKAKHAAFKIVNELRPTLTSIGPEIRIADQPERGRRTIIVMTKMTGIDEVFHRMNQLLSLDAPVQATHITLFVIGGLPIGITSQEELSRFTRALTDEETAQFFEQVSMNEFSGALS